MKGGGLFCLKDFSYCEVSPRLRDYINSKMAGPYDYNYARDYSNISPNDYEDQSESPFSADYMGPNPSYSLGRPGDYGENVYQFKTKMDRDAYLRGEKVDPDRKRQLFAQRKEEAFVPTPNPLNDYE